MKKRRSILIFLVILILLSASPLSGTADVRTKMDMVGEWIWASTIYEAGPDGAEKIISRSAAMGVTDIYLLVKGTAGKVCYQNTEIALGKSYTRRDILQEAINSAHAHGVRLHAWITSIEDKAYKQAHPEAGLYHYKKGRSDDRIHPADPGFNAYMQRLIAELTANYDIDGLHFDYIRYNHLTNGWAQADLDAMAAMGADVNRLKELIETTYYVSNPNANYFFHQYKAGDTDATIFVNYRRGNVISFARGIIDAARAVKPDIIISAAIMPDGATDPAFQNVHYGQDYADAAALYDYIIPMAYSGDYGKNTAWVAQVAKACADQGNKVVVGLQSYSISLSDQLTQEVEAIRALTVDPSYQGKILGIAHFRTGQYSYARLRYTEGENTLHIQLCNASADQILTKLEIRMQKGVAISDVKLLSGFEKDIVTEISADGSTVHFSRKAIKLLGKNAAGELEITFAGTPDPALPIALIQPRLSQDSRTYHVYEVLTKE